MNANQHCTVLQVERIICTKILGLTFWVGFVKLIDYNTDKLDGVIHFINKTDALKLQIGDQVSNLSVFQPPTITINKNTSFNG